jgi:hypothetical protein
VSPRPNAIKGKTEQRATMLARHNALKTGGTRTMPNHTMTFIEPARCDARAGVIAPIRYASLRETTPPLADGTEIGAVLMSKRLARWLAGPVSGRPITGKVIRS